MPFLKFARDRRGYENTFLVHAPRQAGASRLLYWFRTPPYVKIGRAAFDEDAIRLLEQQHPGVEFDWDRILTARPPAAPDTRDPREPRPRARYERRPGRDVRRDPPPARPAAARPSGPTAEPPPAAAAPAPPVAPTVEPAAVLTGSLDAPPPPPLPPPAAPARRFVRVLDAPEARHATEPAVVARLLGAEQLTVLRARHAEILARISARGGDPARLEALREQAERVNPDAWVTEADVREGLATVDSALAELHRIVGRRRRRRRRAGGQAGAPAALDALTGELSSDEAGDDEGGPDEDNSDGDGE